MGSQFIVLNPPTVEPITVPDFRDFANIDFSEKDAMIGRLISRARSYAETVTGRALATQTLQQLFTIQRPTGGEISGPINRGPNWYQYQEQLGANPFGATQFYFDLAMPPVQSTIQNIVIETRVTAFQNWTVFPLIHNADGTYNLFIDNIHEPARIYFMSPITANFWRFTYTCGYNANYPMPPDLQECLYELTAFWFDNREGENIPQWLLNKLLARRASWFGLGQ